MERQPLLWAAAHVRSKTELLCRVVGSERHAPGDIILQFADGQTDLLHGITIPDRHTVVGGVFSSPTVWKSTVIQKGVPISSWRR